MKENVHRGVHHCFDRPQVCFFGNTQGRTQGVGGVGVKTPLELDILQNFITCAKEINCFRIVFAC